MMIPIETQLKKGPTSTAWNTIGVRHHHGINLPLAAIRTKKSAGIGEFFDLLPLIDWCAQLKLDIIQLLPLNESGKNEPSPYNALSSCALHPIYLSLHALPYRNAASDLQHLTSLNDTKQVAYQKVYELKLTYLCHYLAAVDDQLKSEPTYTDFLATQEWLTEYALFKVFKNKHNDQNWQEWPEEERHPSKTQLKKWLKEYAREVDFYCLLQYLCFNQLKAVKAYAERHNVWLKGDIPILVNPDSADVWAHRTFFHLDRVVGRPSSNLEPDGQYWGFPLYNWKAMEENHHEWWKKRLQTASQLYHIYRIDHIIGFFCLWTIPAGQSPKTGCYFPSNPDLMRAQGRHLLETLLSFTEMLPIGEDLGDPYPFIKETLASYGIPGTKVFRWERDWERNSEFIAYSDYPPISMSSVSTHDLDTTPLWWQKFPSDAAAYAAFKKWRYSKTLHRDQLLEILWDNHHSGSLIHINLLQEYLALTPELTWDNPEDERINYPGTIKSRNWTYRYKMPLETLLTDQALSDFFRHILT
ncbi:MAG: 4-alpha-glucanotransferase [Chlamydiota bacterium]